MSSNEEREEKDLREEDRDSGSEESEEEEDQEEDQGPGGDWGEEGEEAETEAEKRCASLFDPSLFFPSSKLVLEDAKASFSFDLDATRSSWKLNFFESVKLLNYIRAKSRDLESFADGKKFDNKDELLTHLKTVPFASLSKDSFSHVFDDDQWLIPVVVNDPLLRGFSNDDEEWSDEDAEDSFLQTRITAEDNTPLIENIVDTGVALQQQGISLSSLRS